VLASLCAATARNDTKSADLLAKIDFLKEIDVIPAPKHDLDVGDNAKWNKPLPEGYIRALEKQRKREQISVKGRIRLMNSRNWRNAGSKVITFGSIAAALAAAWLGR
jgi:hypothetical protein